MPVLSKHTEWHCYCSMVVFAMTHIIRTILTRILETEVDTLLCTSPSGRFLLHTRTQGVHEKEDHSILLCVEVNHDDKIENPRLRQKYSVRWLSELQNSSCIWQCLVHNANRCSLIPWPWQPARSSAKLWARVSQRCRLKDNMLSIQLISFILYSTAKLIIKRSPLRQNVFVFSSS